MAEAFVCEGTRTPIGKFGGGLSSIRTDDLAAIPLVSIKQKLQKSDWDNLEEVFTNTDNYKVQPGGSFNCFMVPRAWVIDGVENVRLDDRGVFKRLPNSIDVGYIQHRGGYQGVSIKRKVQEIINGRTIYQDTNNSTNDFLTNQEPTPGVIATN